MARRPKIFVAGHRGMVGSALIRRLGKAGFDNIVVRNRRELDLLDQRSVYEFLAAERPDYVFDAAARVGGIQANSRFGAQFLFENLTIQNNVIHGAHLAGVQRLMFLGSSCIYPRSAPQPLKEEYLLTGPLEPTNAPYAVAKIAGIKLCETYSAQYGREYVSVMPTNLYGPNDRYDLENSHVLPALLLKAHEAKQRGDGRLVVWGSGNPLREFLHVDDLADACVFLMERNYTGSLVNIGTGHELTIRALAEMIVNVVGFGGSLEFDLSKPDGMPRKLLDVSKLASMGWKASIDLRPGLEATYRDFVAHATSGAPARST
jgi:GDP-L-fucose synthase